MRLDRSFVGWGVFFILVGAVPLAVRGGLLDAGALGEAWRLWPLLLVGAGLGILLRRTVLADVGGLLVAATFGVLVGSALAGGFGDVVGAVCGSADQAIPFERRSGDFSGSSASVEMDLSCGTVALTTASGSTWQVSGRGRSSSGPDISSGTDSLTIHSPKRPASFGVPSIPDDWAIAIPTDRPVSFDLQLDAATARFDLAGATVGPSDVELDAGSATFDLSRATRVDGFDVQVNAGSVAIALPVASMTGEIEANAGSVKLCAPAGVAIRLRTSGSSLASFSYDGHGLIHDGSTWTSPDFDTAATRIDLTTQGNAASFSLDPAEGCGG